jgi:hypothetical protein
MRRSKVWVLVTLSVLSLAAGCGRSDEITTAPPAPMPQPAVSPEPTATLDSGTTGPAPVCPPARGEGTVSPAVSIYSITFVVNGLEQVVRAGDTLQAVAGDDLEVREISICADAFSGNGGEVCVDFAPVDPGGQEMMSEHGGTHMVRMMPGFVTLPGPGQPWTVGENWRSISAVLNHWPPGETADVGCGNRRCEHDDQIIIGLR